MEISHKELVQALTRALDAGMVGPDELAGYAVGYLGGIRWAQEQSGPAIEAVLPSAPTTTVLWPERLETEEDMGLAWPEGTVVTDNDGDVFLRCNGRWAWAAYDDGTEREIYYGADDSHFLRTALPATVDHLGVDDTPKVGDLVRSRIDAVGEAGSVGDHTYCHQFTGPLSNASADGMYDNGSHYGPLSDFEKVG